MNFSPAPKNEFAEFIELYYRECRSRIPAIEAIAGKWTFEDLIPGMSDFDTRFICSDGMEADDWCRMSEAVGEVHLKLCRSYPRWARILEHLPGINLTWKEFTGEQTFYPEYRQWSFYHTTRPEVLKPAEEKTTRRAWDEKDEFFHLRKFLTFFGPYDRSIDPPVNLGPYGNKYALHSRLMHYFTPPLQSAISLLRRKAVGGKMEALRLGREILSREKLCDQIIMTVEKHYELPGLYREPRLSELESELYAGLKAIARRLEETLDFLPGRTGPEEWKQALRRRKAEPAGAIFASAKFARLMKGRLYFYTHVPDHFDNVWLLDNELGRMGSNLFRRPFSIYWEALRGEEIDDPARIVPALAPDLLTREEVRDTLEFDRLTRRDWRGREVETAEKIISVFDGFFHALSKITLASRTLP